jgi:nucleoside-diphosphate-sugar epimerase
VRVLVTGAGGFIGRAVLAAAPAGVEVVPLCREAAAVPGAVVADLADPRFDRVLPSQLDAVVHLAQSPDYRNFPDGAGSVVDVNVAATARLLDYARRAGAARFVLASTGTVYRPSELALTEDAPIDPTSIYAVSKRCAELLTVPYRDLLHCRVLRVFTVYGAHQPPRQLVADLIDRVQGGRAVEVSGQRGMVLTPVHVGDVAAAFWAAVTAPGEAHGETEILNVGGDAALGLLDIAEAIGRAVGRPPVVSRRAAQAPAGYVADCTRAGERLGWRPALDFDAGLLETLPAVPRV